VIRKHRVVERAPAGAAVHLRRALGTAGVYAIGYGNVGSSIYYALGIVAAYALGATPIALALAGIIFIFTAMTYAEGISMVPTAGGSVAFARRAFNDLFSFVAGWAFALSYVVTTAISAVAAAFYLSYFWPALKEQPALAALGGIVITFLLMLLNLRGVRETARLNIGFAAIDLATQGLLVLLGISLILGGWRNLLSYRFMGPDYWPDARQLVFAVAMAMVAYVGLESAAMMAEETKTPTRTVPRALFWSVVTVLFMFAALPIVALCAMPPMELVSEWGNDPVAGIASKLPDWQFASGAVEARVQLSHLMMPWVAVLAFTILAIAANAGILAGSRLVYNMAHHKQVFAYFSRVHPRYQTPAFAITAVSVLAMGIIGLGMKAHDLLLRLGGLYVFSSMLCFSMAHLSVWWLRLKEPDTHRPFWAWPTVRIAGRPISVTATLGFLACAAIWVWMAVSKEHVFGRNIGLAWLVIGLLFYVWYRRRETRSDPDGGHCRRVAAGDVLARPSPQGNDPTDSAHLDPRALSGVCRSHGAHRLRPRQPVRRRHNSGLRYRGAALAASGRRSLRGDAPRRGRPGGRGPHCRHRLRCQRRDRHHPGAQRGRRHRRVCCAERGGPHPSRRAARRPQNPRCAHIRDHRRLHRAARSLRGLDCPLRTEYLPGVRRGTAG